VPISHSQRTKRLSRRRGKNNCNIQSAYPLCHIGDTDRNLPPEKEFQRKAETEFHNNFCQIQKSDKATEKIKVVAESEGGGGRIEIGCARR
jgi:hypothetical protein